MPVNIAAHEAGELIIQKKKDFRLKTGDKHLVFRFELDHKTDNFAYIAANTFLLTRGGFPGAFPGPALLIRLLL
jgi:hypothetical protein